MSASSSSSSAPSSAPSSAASSSTQAAAAPPARVFASLLGPRGNASVRITPRDDHRRLEHVDTDELDAMFDMDLSKGNAKDWLTQDPIVAAAMTLDLPIDYGPYR